MESFLKEVIEKGWSEERRTRFLERYGHIIRRSIMYQIMQKFGSQSLSTVNNYLLSFQGRKPPNSGGAVIGEILDLAVNTWQDVLTEIFKEEENLLHKYSRFTDKIDKCSENFPDFSYFLFNSVNYKFLDNLSIDLSQKEILDRVVDLKREVSRKFYIDAFRKRYRGFVKDNLRSKYPEVHRVNNVIDYFFEKFVPQTYPTVREKLENTKSKKTALIELLEHFDEDHCERGSRYTREIFGGLEEVKISLSEKELKSRYESELKRIPLNAEVNNYWDQIIRCLSPDPEKIKRELININQNEANVLCWACAKLKRKLKRKEQRENLIAFIVFYCSKGGIEQKPLTKQKLTSENLTLEKVTGRNFRWRKDVCTGIFGKYIRKNRVIKQIKEEIINSNYSYLITEEE